MQSTLSEQIQAIQKARMLVIKEATSPNTSEVLKAAYLEIYRLLNDAGFTIAALNLTNGIPMTEKEIVNALPAFASLLFKGQSLISVLDEVIVYYSEVMLKSQEMLSKYVEKYGTL